MRFQPPKGDHKMITGKKCPKSYFIAKLQAVRQEGKSHSQSWHEASLRRNNNLLFLFLDFFLDLF